MAPKGKWASPIQKAVVEWLTAHPAVGKNELARQAEIDKSVVIRLTNGEKSDIALESAAKLAAVMGITIEDLRAGRSTPVGGASADAFAAGDLVLLPLSALAPNPWNPRDHFDPEKIAELAESIAAEGLLQNLSVSPARPDGIHVVIFGGRRLQALELLAETARWDRDAPLVTCRILAGDEGRVRALALIENLLREPLSPIAEGRAFNDLAALDKERFTNDGIAKAIHRTPRFVQQRRAIVNKLAPEILKELEAGKVSIEEARILTMAPRKRQKELFEDRQHGFGGGWETVEDLREQVTSGWYPTDIAIFAADAYSGEISEGDEADPEHRRWFTDGKQFERLQLAAAKDKAEDLRAQRAWVRFLDKGYFDKHAYSVSRKKDLSDTGCVVRIDHEWKVEIHDGLTEKPKQEAAAARTAATSDGDETDGPAQQAMAVQTEPKLPFTKGLLTYARQRKTEALQDAVLAKSRADDGDTAMRLAILGILGFDLVKLNAHRDRRGDFKVQGPATRAVIERIAGELEAKCKDDGRNKRHRFAPMTEAELVEFLGDLSDLDRARERLDEISAGELADDDEWKIDRAYEGLDRLEAALDEAADREEKGALGREAAVDDTPDREEPPPAYNLDARAVWTWLDGLDRAGRVEVFAALIADQTGTWSGHNPQPAHDDVDVAVARHVALDMTTNWTPEADYLAGSRKARLEALAKGLGLMPPKRTVELRDLLAKTLELRRRGGHADPALPPADLWFPPEMLVLDATTLDLALKGATTTPAAEPPAMAAE